MGAKEPKSLWGNISADIKLETPVSLLRTQAAYLSRLTRGILDGRVSQANLGGNTFQFKLSIVVPALENYTVGVLTMVHGVSLYPVRIFDEFELGHTHYEAKTSEEVESAFKEIFNGAELQDLLRGLIAQANAMTQGEETFLPKPEVESPDDDIPF